jgi:hypothetical protein
MQHTDGAHGRSPLGNRRADRRGLAAVLLPWLGAWTILAARFVLAGHDGASGAVDGVLLGLLLVPLPVAAGALVGWSRQGQGPSEPEPGPATVRYVALTEGLAAAVGAGLQVLNLAIILAASTVQAEPPPGREESWWEPLIWLLLAVIAGLLQGLVGGSLGGLLAAGWQRVRRRGRQAPPIPGGAAPRSDVR